MYPPVDQASGGYSGGWDMGGPSSSGGMGGGPSSSSGGARPKKNPGGFTYTNKYGEKISGDELAELSRSLDLDEVEPGHRGKYQRPEGNASVFQKRKLSCFSIKLNKTRQLS